MPLSKSQPRLHAVDVESAESIARQLECQHCAVRKHELQLRRREIKQLREALKMSAANYLRVRSALMRMLDAIRRESHHIEDSRVHQKSIRGY